MCFWKSQWECLSFLFFFQFTYPATGLIQEGKHFCRTCVLCDSFFYIHKTLGNKTVKGVSGNHTKPLHACPCLNTYIYLPGPSDWPVPEQGKDSLVQEKWQMPPFDNFWGPAHRRWVRSLHCSVPESNQLQNGNKVQGSNTQIYWAKIENPGLLSMEKYQGNSV